MSKANLLSEYEGKRPCLLKLGNHLQAQLEELARNSDCAVHSVSMRLKSSESLNQKLSRPDRTYRQLEEVTDLVGLRVITYFDGSVSTIAKCIERKFSLDLKHCVDKRLVTDPTRFGYRSLHYVCAFPEDLLKDTGLSYPSPLRFEIQVRTILQHAWAEIEHDLGYHSSVEIPSALRRRFSRVASLLELADEEFLTIHQQLAEYRSKIGEPDFAQGIAIDKISLSLLCQGEAVYSIDAAIAKKLGLPLTEEPFYPEYLIKMLGLVGFSALQSIELAVETRRDEILNLVEPYFQFAKETWGFSRDEIDSVQRGYGLLFLAHAELLGNTHDLEIDRLSRATNFFRELDYPEDEASAKRTAARLLQALRAD